MGKVHIIGGGLAGCEAAWQIASRGVKVILHEMRPEVETAAHQTSTLAELVCSNSFRSDDWQNNAVGLLHEEMRYCNSIIMQAADKHKLPAGGALAVDRELFAKEVETAIVQNEFISVVRDEVTSIADDWENIIIASGPLTSKELGKYIIDITGEEELSFFDAIAPIVYRETIDFDICWMQSRYDKGEDGADYINCPLDERQYNNFIDELLGGEKTSFKDWEENTPYFDGCLPIEVMAERGRETLRYGPMKPVGLTNQHQKDIKPYAVVQLRQDNNIGSLYNIVGFQTKLKYAEQKRIFRMIPGMENAEFARLGGLHRNSFINSPKVLDQYLRLKNQSNIRFAGQITGVEGYVESAAIGLLAGIFTANDIMGIPTSIPSATTAMGSLLNHITIGHISGESKRTFQPMNINYGLFPDIGVPKVVDGTRLRGKEKSRFKKKMLSNRAIEDIKSWLSI